MAHAPQIDFRNVTKSQVITDAIQRNYETLEKVYPRITKCHVSIETPQPVQRKGRLYRVLVDLKIPGGELIASRELGGRNSHTDIYRAIREAFSATRRQLLSRLKKRQSYSAV